VEFLGLNTLKGTKPAILPLKGTTTMTRLRRFGAVFIIYFPLWFTGNLPLTVLISLFSQNLGKRKSSQCSTRLSRVVPGPR